MENLKAKYIDSPLGTIEVLASDNGIVAISLGAEKDKADSDAAVLLDAATQMNEYFETSACSVMRCSCADIP